MKRSKSLPRNYKSNIKKGKLKRRLSNKNKYIHPSNKDLKDDYSNQSDKANICNISEKLDFVQETNTNNILKELYFNKRKMSHWIWWFFPTGKPGNNDKYKIFIPIKYHKNLLYNLKILNNLKYWKSILQKLIIIISEKGKNGFNFVIPTIDKGRINYFFIEWNSNKNTWKNIDPVFTMLYDKFYELYIESI